MTELKEVECSLCHKPTTEYCSTLACRDCHVSVSFEACVNRTTPMDLAWKAQKEAALRANGIDPKDLVS